MTLEAVEVFLEAVAASAAVVVEVLAASAVAASVAAELAEAGSSAIFQAFHFAVS